MKKTADVIALQGLIVDALEDVKGKDIVVFDTEHLSALFERVIIVSVAQTAKRRHWPAVSAINCATLAIPSLGWRVRATVSGSLSTVAQRSCT